MVKLVKKERGFTLIEMVLVITILGILAAAAIPTFTNITADARRAARDGVVGAVRSGISLFRAKCLVTGTAPDNVTVCGDAFPTAAQLDANGIAVCTGCFGGVLQNVVNDARWAKTAANTWTYNDGTTTVTYTYTAATGSFL